MARRTNERWQAAAGGSLGQLADESIKLAAAYYLANSTRDWDVWSGQERANMIRNGVPQALPLLSALIKEGWADRIRTTENVKDVVKLADELYRRLFPSNESEDQQEEEKAAGEGNADGQPEKGEGEGTPSACPEGTVIPWQQFLASNHDESGENKSGCAIDWRGYPPNKSPAVPLLHHIIQKAEPHGTAQWVTSAGINKEMGLAEQARILLLAKTKARWQYNKLSGRLNKRVLGKLALPVVAGTGDAQRRVFKRKTEGLKLDTAVTVLMDGSGSMLGQKIATAGQCLLRLGDTLGRALRLPLELTVFSGGMTSAESFIIKRHREPMPPIEAACALVNGAIRKATGGNADGDVILAAFDRLRALPQKRKVIIVLSDGAPSVSAGIDPGAMLHAAIHAVRRRGGECYGIGIMTNCVTAFYGERCKVVHSVSEINRALIETLKEAILV
jgi:cobaltochelatase CobT